MYNINGFHGGNGFNGGNSFNSGPDSSMGFHGSQAFSARGHDPSVFRGAGAALMSGPPSIQSTPRTWADAPPRPQNIHDRIEFLEQELLSMRSPREPQAQTGPPPFPHAAQMMSYHAGPPQPQTPQVLQLDYSPPACAQPGYANTVSVPAPITAKVTASEPVVSVAEHKELLQSQKLLIDMMAQQSNQHQELMKAHTDLMRSNKAHTEALKTCGLGGRAGAAPKKGARARTDMKPNPSLGVVRLDYDYPPAAGDIDSPASYGYDVIYRSVPKLTFAMAQAGKFTEEVEREFAEAIKYLEMRGVSAITGDCGFMMAFQVKARQIASKPVFMSSMVQCPVIATAFDPKDCILILTANGHSLRPQKEILLSSCGFDVNEDRFFIQGCQDIPGFDAVAKGEAVPLDIVQPGMVKLVLETLKKKPNISAILLECTELPPYADALRAATGLPVWDAITGADFYISAYQDNPRFGIDDWQQAWDQEQEDYSFGQNLTQKDREALVNKAAGGEAKAKKKPERKQVDAIARKLKKKANPTLGVIRLDYNYPPAKGDIDCPGSYGYDVLFRCVPGLTFEMAQAGKMTLTVEKEFKMAVKWLEAKGVCGITGDCGFMMAFQPIARDIASVPVFMSAMVQCPMISVAFDKYDKILILTANSATLKPQKQTLLSACGFDVDDDRFVIIGLQDVPGFDAVAKGAKVDVDFVTPGIVKVVKDAMMKLVMIRAICLECTELPPYADALRASTRLPVFDAITCTDFFVSAYKDNPRFGLNNWQSDWDNTVDEYKLGDNLSKDQRQSAEYVQ